MRKSFGVSKDFLEEPAAQFPPNHLLAKAGAWLTGLLALVLVGACHTVDSSVEVSSGVFETVDQDNEYESLLKTYSHSTSIFHDFDKLYDVHVTYLSPEFMGAFEKRLKERFKHQTLMEDVNEHIGFFASIFSPQNDLNDLNQEGVWEILLAINGEKEASPALIKTMTSKKHWSSFFPYISLWSREYLILFKRPSKVASSETLQSKEKVSLSLSNLQARTVMTW